MKKVLTYLVYAPTFLLFLGLASCKKDETTPTETNPDPTPASAKKLLKKIHIDDDGDNFYDESFTYNADSLVSTRLYTESYDAGMDKREWRSFFFYNAADPKPVKDSTVYTQITSMGTKQATTISYYTYDAQNRITKTASYSATGALVYQKIFSYAPGLRIEDYFLTDQAGNGIPFVYYHDTLSINTQNQVTQILSGNTGLFTASYKTLYSFDSHKNPYYDLNTIKYGARGTDSAYAVEHTIGPNNYINVKRYNSDTTTPFNLFQEIENSYTYNDDGYPVSNSEVESYYPSGGGMSNVNSAISIAYEYY